MPVVNNKILGNDVIFFQYFFSPEQPMDDWFGSIRIRDHVDGNGEFSPNPVGL